MAARRNFSRPTRKLIFTVALVRSLSPPKPVALDPPKCLQADPKKYAEPFWNKIIKFFDLSCLVKKVILRIYCQTFWSGSFELPRARRSPMNRRSATNRCARQAPHSGGNDRFCARLKTDISAFSSGLI
jgi:hypothetical protein